MQFLQALSVKTGYFFVNNISQDFERIEAEINGGALYLRESKSSKNNNIETFGLSPFFVRTRE